MLQAAINKFAAVIVFTNHVNTATLYCIFNQYTVLIGAYIYWFYTARYLPMY